MSYEHFATGVRTKKVISSVGEVLERIFSEAPRAAALAQRAATVHDVCLGRCADAFSSVQLSQRNAISTSKALWEESAESNELSAELLSLSVTSNTLADKIAAFSSGSEGRFVQRLHSMKDDHERASASANSHDSETTTQLEEGARVLTRSGPGEVRRMNSGWNDSFLEIELDWGGVLYTRAVSLLRVA